MTFQPIKKLIELIDESLLPDPPASSINDCVREELAEKLEHVVMGVDETKESINELQHLVKMDLTGLHEELEAVLDKYNIYSHKARNGELDHLLLTSDDADNKKESIKDFITIAIVDDDSANMLRNEGEIILDLPGHMDQNYMWVTDRYEIKAREFLEELHAKDFLEKKF